MCILQLAPCFLRAERMNHKGAVTGCNFSSNFNCYQLAQISRLELIVEVVTRHDLIIIFIITIHVYYMSKVTVTSWFSPENRSNNWTQSDFQLTLKLCFRLGRSHGMLLVESKSRKSDEKSHHLTAPKHTTFR